MAYVTREVSHWLRSCWEFMMCAEPEPPNADDEVADPLLWSYDLGTYAGGEFSMAVIRGNENIEDRSLVEVGDGAIFVGIYDGHGGDTTARYVCENLFPVFNNRAQAAHDINANVLTSTYEQVENDFMAIVDAEFEANPAIKGVGTCCLVGVIRGGTLHVANAGDSRVVLGRTKLCKVVASPLTIDDNVGIQSVRDRARQNINSHVDFVNGAWRVRGIIQVCKSIGDAYLKDSKYNFERGHPLHLAAPLEAPAISAVPSVLRRRVSICDQFLIFASDGLWDHLSNQEAVDIVHKNPRNGIAKLLIKRASMVAAEKIGSTYQALVAVEAEHRRRIHDDISVVVVYLDRRRFEVPNPVQIRGNEPETLPGRFNLG